jgi:hypothetical protein
MYEGDGQKDFFSVVGQNDAIVIYWLSVMRGEEMIKVKW